MILAWLKSLTKRTGGGDGRSRHRSTRTRALPRVEQLEDRSVPAAITVTNLNAEGAGSLYKAVQDINNSQDFQNSISFQQGLTGTISLENPLILAKSVTITGPGSANLTVQRSYAQGMWQFRVFQVNTVVMASLSGMTIKNGDAVVIDLGGNGAGIHNNGSLSLYDVVVRDNDAAGKGGGIANFGMLSGDDIAIHDNEADDGNGGGLYNKGTASFTDYVGIYSNLSSGDGGGIYNDTGASLSLGFGASIHHNKAQNGSGGGIYNKASILMSGGSIEDNEATGGGYGGGIFNSTAGGVTISNVSIKRNSAAKGGGVYVFAGTLTLQSCTIQDNLASVLGSLGCRKPDATLNLNNCTTNGTNEVDS